MAGFFLYSLFCSAHNVDVMGKIYEAKNKNSRGRVAE
jgi:hypothetical protein